MDIIDSHSDGATSPVVSARLPVGPAALECISQPDDGFVNSLFAFVHNYQLDLTCQGPEAWQTSP